MISSDVLDLINDIEERFPVEQWVIGGLHIWPILRITLYFDLIFANDKNAKSKHRKYLFDMFNKTLKEVVGISKYGYAFLFDYKKNSQALHTLFNQEMLSRGFLTSKSVYVSWSHKKNHIKKYLENVDEVFSLISKAIKDKNIYKLLRGPVVHQGFKRLT